MFPGRVVPLIGLTIRQGSGLTSEIAPGQVRSQVVLSDQMVMLAGFCVQVGPWGVGL